MKKRTKILSAICATSIAFSIFATSSAFAATKTYKLGDVNGDGKVSSTDAAEIQRYLVGYSTFTDAQKKAADVNFDGKISSVDATTIQRYLVGYMDSFYQLSSNTWTTSYKASTKTFKLNTNVNFSYQVVNYVGGTGWVTVKKTSSSSFTVTVPYNSSSKNRGATINIKIDDEVLPVTIKQLGNLTTGYDACYTYAMDLGSDPRVAAGQYAKKFDYDTNPGTPGRISQKSQYSNYDIKQFNVISCNSNIFTSFENYTMDYVKADMQALGWGIKKVSGPNAKVTKGNWLVALAFNPTEIYSDDKQLVYITDPSDSSRGNVASVTAPARDQHWFRRVDNSDGTSYWTHKRGQSAVANLASGKTPSDVTSTDTTTYYNTLASYINGYKTLYQKYLNGTYRADPEEYDYELVYSYKATSKMEDVMSNYYLIGYYEVGPNV